MNHQPIHELEWCWDQEGKCHRAVDKNAMYIIEGDDDNGYQVVVIQGADAISIWRKSIPTLDRAMIEAGECAEEVKKLRREMGYET